MRRRVASWLGVAAVALGFAWGLHRLFALRFSAGDVYPAYSSMRADPLGCRAFFEGLGLLSRLEVRRLFEPLRTLASGTNTTLLVLGADPVDFHESSEAEAAELAAFLERGGRLVVALAPVNEEPFEVRIRNRPPTTPPPKGKPSRNPPGQRVIPAPHEVSLQTRWGFGVAYDKLELNDDHVAKPVTVTLTNGPAGLPASLDWHSATVFTGLDTAWRPVYVRGSRPVMIEREMGHGSIVLSADSFFASNEALRTARQPALLAWFVNAAQRVVFDEVHLGVAIDPGIATLARRYRLQGFFAALFALAGLYVWKSASPFVPARPDEAGDAAAVAGRDAGAGFVNLLRRGIPPRQVLEVCLDEWRRHPGTSKASSERKLPRIEEARAAAADDPVAGYRQISQILAER